LKFGFEVPFVPRRASALGPGQSVWDSAQQYRFEREKAILLMPPRKLHRRLEVIGFRPCLSGYNNQVIGLVRPDPKDLLMHPGTSWSFVI
jgi:hypothetical protein